MEATPLKPHVRTFFTVRYAASLFSSFSRYPTALRNWWRGSTSTLVVTTKDSESNTETDITSSKMAAVGVLSPTFLPVRLDTKPNAAAVVEVRAIEDIENINPTPLHTHIDNKPRRSSNEGAGSLISASLITTDFDALRFEAAASLQLLNSQSLSTSTPKSHHLISSPYNDPAHLLDLRRLDTQNRLLAQALSFLKPIKDDYATGDYLSSFNWDEVLTALRTLAAAEGHAWTEQVFYTVIFRSKLNGGVDEQRLHDLDKDSHKEAVDSGGLLKYWFGKRDVHEQNLATCKSSFRRLSEEAVC
jgi:hypothetical protein